MSKPVAPRRDASFEIHKSKTLGDLAKINAWSRSRPPWAERKRCWKLVQPTFHHPVAALQGEHSLGLELLQGHKGVLTP